LNHDIASAIFSGKITACYQKSLLEGKLILPVSVGECHAVYMTEFIFKGDKYYLSAEALAADNQSGSSK
jgi:hypothetical protein